MLELTDWLIARFAMLGLATIFMSGLMFFLGMPLWLAARQREDDERGWRDD